MGKMKKACFLFSISFSLAFAINSFAMGSGGTADNASAGKKTVARSGREFSIDLGGGAAIEMVRIPSGTFRMGSGDGADDEKPVHHVNISDSFYMGKYEVTQLQWRLVMGNNPSANKSDALPVQRVSWNDCQAFVTKLNAVSKAYGADPPGRFRLPTEAEWEFACRAESAGKYYWGEKIDGSCFWHQDNSGYTAHRPGKCQPNAFGLFDMSGNVSEWCQDEYRAGYSGAPADGSAREPEKGGPSVWRAYRGGGWNSPAEGCRSARRYRLQQSSSDSTLGFRLVFELER